MPTAPSRHLSVGLLHFTLLAAILAVLAGLLGMHVLSGAHGAHASAQHSAAQSHTAAPSGHAASDHPGSENHHETPTPPSCVCGGDCGDQPAAHVSCTPAPSGASLSAPPPGTALLAVQPRTAPATEQTPGYSHLPATPTPGELSISRT